MAEKPTYEQIRSAGIVERRDARPPHEVGVEMVTVRCLLDGFRDNGHTYRFGDVLHMEISMAASAIAADQVELVKKE
jgi:hypothetical protein